MNKKFDIFDFRGYGSYECHKCIRPTSDKRAKSADGDFTFAILKDLQELCHKLGKRRVCCISFDDKASVRLGVIAAKQRALVMSVHWRVKLPDHDYSIPQHSLMTGAVLT